jgi:MFS family permease
MLCCMAFTHRGRLSTNEPDGMTNSYGVFQEYYSTHQLSDQTATAISWIGSIQLCFCPLLGCISGPLFDAGYLKHLIVVGGSIYVFCMMMTSIATQYWQFLLAHGIGVGLGMGLIFSPSVGTLSHHFARSRYRTLAYGCQASGSALAGVIIPIMLRYLFPAVGFGWGMRIRKSTGQDHVANSSPSSGICSATTRHSSLLHSIENPSPTEEDRGS